MRLWTIQPEYVYDEILKKGFYAFNKEKAIEADEFWEEFFKPAYNWLVDQMASKIGNPPEGIDYPMWAWHTYDWKRKSSDLRQRQGTRGEKFVRLEIDIPDENVVLSDFDAWHFVLSNQYMPEVYNENDWDEAFDIFEKKSLEEQNIIKEKSWEDIFNLSPVHSDWINRGQYIQATFWKLDKSQIIKVKHFISK